MPMPMATLTLNSCLLFTIAMAITTNHACVLRFIVIICLRQYAPNNVSLDEVVILNETPSGKKVGNDFGDDEAFQVKKPKTSSFKIVRVKGQVTWKYNDSGEEENAELLLKRLVTTNGKTRASDELTLAEYSHGSSSDEFTTSIFDFKPDNDPFWQTDGEGKVMPGLK